MNGLWVCLACNQGFMRRNPAPPVRCPVCGAPMAEYVIKIKNKGGTIGATAVTQDDNDTNKEHGVDVVGRTQ